jgi:hypothetical protein
VSQYYRRQIEEESGHSRESEDAQGEEEYDEDFEDTCMEVYRDAHEQGEALWDQWFEGACERVDAASGRLAEPVAQGLPGGEPLHRDGDALPAGLRDEIAAVAAEVAGRDGGGSFHSWTRSTYSTSALAAALAEPANVIDPTPRSPLDAKARFTPFR